MFDISNLLSPDLVFGLLLFSSSSIFGNWPGYSEDRRKWKEKSEEYWKKVSDLSKDKKSGEKKDPKKDEEEK
jgi:hypothetical protein